MRTIGGRSLCLGDLSGRIIPGHCMHRNYTRASPRRFVGQIADDPAAATRTIEQNFGGRPRKRSRPFGDSPGRIEDRRVAKLLSTGWRTSDAKLQSLPKSG
jgi:hypothetical protein